MANLTSLSDLTADGSDGSDERDLELLSGPGGRLKHSRGLGLQTRVIPERSDMANLMSLSDLTDLTNLTDLTSGIWSCS